MKKYLSILITAALLTVSVGPAYAAESSQNKEYEQKLNRLIVNFDEPAVDTEEVVEEPAVDSEEVGNLDEADIVNKQEQQKMVAGSLKEKATSILVFSTYIAYRVFNWERKFEKIRDSQVEEAVEEAYSSEISGSDYDWRGKVKENTVLKVFDVRDEQIILTFGDVDREGMTHIIGRHHPKYFATNYKSGQTFFTPATEFSYVEDVIQSIIDTGDVARTIEKRINTRDAYEYDGYHNGEKYRMVVEREKIITVYPVSYNKAKKG
ncbi:hypothetical protein ABH14_19630 [Brevibacillus brevis]|uniref:hypothetical protein n=1 Tax=Brevibacillus brevis TaxID=1393 RepID=UPI0018FF1D8B|nr:hypothetical protein [Brevibacillus brevis]MBH0331939.1 hypothetical protein [Brevibacillus brevis]